MHNIKQVDDEQVKGLMWNNEKKMAHSKLYEIYENFLVPFSKSGYCASYCAHYFVDFK